MKHYLHSAKANPGIVMFYALAGAMLSPEAFAESAYSGFYVGGGYGKSDFKIVDDACDQALDEVQQELRDEIPNEQAYNAVFTQFQANTNCNVDATDNAWKVYVGYQFNPYFSVEGGYVDLGNIDADFSTGYAESGASISAVARAHGSVSGYEMVGLFSLPVADMLSLYAKAGVFLWDAELEGMSSATASINGYTAGTGESVDESDSGADVTWGGGARISLGQNVRLRADYSRYEVIDTDFISADLEFLFN